MIASSSRLRLSAGLLALSLALSACGGADEPAQEASSPAAADTAAPSRPSSPTTSRPASSSAGAATTAAPSSTSAAASSATESAADAETPAADDEPTADEPVAGDVADAEDLEESGAPEDDAASPTAEAVVLDPVEAPAAQDLGGPQPGVAPSDTPVAVRTPAPAIAPVKVEPDLVRPSAPPVEEPGEETSPPAPRPSASASEGRPSAPGTPVPAPTATAPPAPAPVPPSGADCVVQRCIALTFDDGPARPTGRLLDILAAEGVPATFYVIGQSAELNPALIARMGEEGHQVGGHSWSHPNLTLLSPAEIADELARTDAAIRAAGVVPSTVRAPYGALNETVLEAFGDHGEGSVTWSVDTRDWEHRSPAQTLAHVRSAARPGGIVLMHDLHATTVDAVPAVIEWLRGEGYVFVTVDEITGGVAPGATVSRGLHP